MSLQARQQLVNSGRLVFQRDSQRTDLLDPTLTQTELVGGLLALSREFYLELTAVKSDHHDDSGLGLHCHFNGYAADLWPLNSSTAGDYMDAGDPKFRDFLGALAQVQFHYQTGLAGSAYTPENMAAAGPTAFCDDGGDHVHCGFGA